MRDPFSWSFPLGRLFGVAVRVHVLLPAFMVAMVLRLSYDKDAPQGIWLDVCAVLGLGFFSILLHEFGHVFAARAVEGDAQEVLLWPLGGLARCEVPHTWRADFITTAGGPAVNMMLCALTGGILAALSYVPPLNPTESPYRPKLYNWANHTEVYAPGERSRSSAADVADGAKAAQVRAAEVEPGRATLNAGEVLLARLFWVNWVLLLLNLLPGFPLDGGQMLRDLLWWRGDYRQATQTAIYVGFGLMFILGIWGVIVDSVLPLLLAMFVFVSCRQQWFILETGGEENLFGYDFSQGYTSLERDQPAPAPRRRQPNFFQRWLQRRAQRKLQREQETREAEERRMDELLEKVQQQGLQALTDEERRFLTRVSARYRNRN